MTDLEKEVELIWVTYKDPQAISIFLNLGRDHLSGLPSDERESSLSSVPARQGEPDCWLFPLKHGSEYVGLTHMKIDMEERLGLGRRLSKLCAGILRDRNVEDVWPLTDQATAEFWSSLGFRETEEIDE